MNELIDMVLGYLRGIWRNRWYALGCAWLVCMIGWTLVFKLPDQYQASARVFINTQTILRPLLQGLAVEHNPDSQILLITRTLLSRPNLEQIAYISGLSAEGVDSNAMNRVIDSLQNKISISGPGRTHMFGVFDNMFTIAFDDNDPQKVKDVLQAVVTVFEKNTTGGDRADTQVAQRFLDQQITEYEIRLSEAEGRLKEFKLRNAGRMPSEGATYNNRMQQVSTELSASRLELTQAENRRNSLRQQIDEALQQQLRGDGEVVVLPIDQRIQNMEQNLDELLIKFTDRHPDVDILRQTIADLKSQREQERLRYAASLAESSGNARGQSVNTVYQQLRIRLAEEEANIASIRTSVGEYLRRYEELQRQSSILPQIEAELSALNRDYEVTRQKYDELVARRESARISQQAEQSNQEVRFKVVDPPRVPSDPTGPNRFLLMSMVLVLGLGAGVGLAFLIAQFWPTFDTRASLTRIADIPVFGSVSAVISPVALRRERRWIAAYVSLGGMLVVAYAGLVIVERIGIL